MSNTKQGDRMTDTEVILNSIASLKGDVDRRFEDLQTALNKGDDKNSSQHKEFYTRIVTLELVVAKYKGAVWVLGGLLGALVGLEKVLQGILRILKV